MNIKFLAICISIFIFFLVIELIRREKMTFKYAVLWLFISILGILCAVYEKILFKIAELFGFELPSNFIFFLISAIFVVISLMLTVYVCQQNGRLESMAQKIGIIELELKNEEKKSAEKPEHKNL